MIQKWTKANLLRVIKLAILTGLCLEFNDLRAQHPWHDLNLQLRNLFSPLQKPVPSNHYLYDMVGHVVDTVYWSSTCNKYITTNDWFMLYKEVYYSAYDTLPIEKTDDLITRGNNYFQDTIPIGIIHNNFYRLKHEALSTNLYFDFDTVNNILSDKFPRPGWPYWFENMFSAAPLVASQSFANATFRIDPAFIKYDPFNAYLYTTGSPEWTFKINFDDGNGWITFNPSVVTHHQVTYSSDGTKKLEVAWFDGNNNKIIFSKSTHRVESGEQLPVGGVDLDFDGIRATMYPACNNTSGIYNKVVIFVEGIDIMDMLTSQNMTAPELYQQYIDDPDIEKLKNFGYDFLVLDWKNSRIDMRTNAEYLVKVIDWLKCQQTESHPFVVMGTSMGGVIARYALTYMETGDYTKDRKRCKPELMHNTRLFISHDAPHQGANIPLSIQFAYRDMQNIASLLFPMTIFVMQKMGAFLDAPAAKQLLINYVNAPVFFSPILIPFSHPSHSMRADFLTSLSNIGSMPQYCKTVAISNGSLSGRRHHVNHFSFFTRWPGDRIADVEDGIYFKLWGIKLQLIGYGLLLKTNPDGVGHIYRAHLGFTFFRVKLYWFGARFELDANSLMDHQKSVTASPHCVNPGSFYEIPGGGFSNLAFSTNGHYYSEGEFFNFIPTWSALDYAHGGNLRPNIEAENINSKMSKTPFDVIIGNADENVSYSQSGDFFEFFDVKQLNGNHLDVYNFRIEEDEMNECDEGFSSNELNNKIINREIGDKQMYLDNWKLNRKNIFQPEYELYVNYPNPYYEYTSWGSTPNREPGVYSKSVPFTIVNGGFAEFRYDVNANYPNGFQLNPVPGISPYSDIRIPLEVCCLTNKELRPSPVNFKETKNTDVDLDVNLFPNPNGGIFTIQIPTNFENCELEIFDFQGKLILNEKVAGETNLYLNLQLNNGIYNIRLKNNYKTFNKKLIIQNQ